jgi:hypothetical protein
LYLPSGISRRPSVIKDHLRQPISRRVSAEKRAYRLHHP